MIAFIHLERRGLIRRKFKRCTVEIGAGALCINNFDENIGDLIGRFEDETKIYGAHTQ